MIEGEIKVGDRVMVIAERGDLGQFYEPGEIVTIAEVFGDVFRGEWSDHDKAGGGPWLNRDQIERVPAPAPAASQHPADLKPRGVKAPLYLIPWDAVPDEILGIGEGGLDAGRAWALRSGDPAEILGAILSDPDAITLEQVAEVFAYGARKYARDNWRAFAWDDSARDEYFGAICRHMLAHGRGETIDPESGQPHLAHAACGALIWRWHERQVARGKDRPDV